MRIAKIFAVAVMMVCFTTSAFAVFVWDIELPNPNYDPAWNKIQSLWKQHWAGNNISDILATLHDLEKRYPTRSDSYLWLARTYLLKAEYEYGGRKENYRKAEQCVVKAHAIDKNSPTALSILIMTLPNIEDTSYTIKNYGEWIKGVVPLKTGLERG